MKLKLNIFWGLLLSLSLLISVYFIFINDNNKNLKSIGSLIIAINIFISIFVFLSPFIFQKQKKDN
jgi:Cu/Ag efflux pump CusA